jgi:hypothetical protein
MKKLTLETLRFSPEIEVLFPNKENSQALIDKHRVIKGWMIDTDWSLQNDRGELAGAEYRPKKSTKLYYNKDSFDQIKEIIGLIKAHSGKVTKLCGGHLHVDASKLSDMQICNIVKAFIKLQPEIIKQFTPLKSRLQKHTRKIPTRVLKLITPKIIKKIRLGTIPENYVDCEYFNDRYFMLNLQSLNEHGSLEFRFFNGSIQIRTIKRNIKWCLEFILNNK